MNIKLAYAKNKLLNNTKYNLSYFGSNTDIRNSLRCNEDKIIKYSELINYKSFIDLLPDDFDYKIILLESSLNAGHWTCVIRMNDTIELFNSYGVEIDKEFKYIPDFIEKLLYENKRYLTEFIKNNNNRFNIISNTFPFQEQNDLVATCSRWIVLRIEMARMNYSLEQFIKVMISLHSKTKVPYDILVVDAVKFINDRI